MIKKVLERLNEKQLNYCKTMSSLIARDREKGLKEQFEKDSGKLRGYLECMEDMEVIRNFEMRGLYLHFLSENKNPI